MFWPTKLLGRPKMTQNSSIDINRTPTSTLKRITRIPKEMTPILKEEKLSTDDERETKKLSQKEISIE